MRDLIFSGYPIVNDVLYNHDSFGPNKGKNSEYGKSQEELIKDVMAAHSAGQWVLDNPETLDDSVTAVPAGVTRGSLDTTYYCSDCPECHIKTKDPPTEHLKMFLHCLKYEVCLKF